MTLSQKQQKFANLVGVLLAWIATQPRLAVTFGETYRTLDQAALNAKKGSGISNSLHTVRLAIDLNLFIDGKYQANSRAYKPLGDFWKTLDPDCCWGGDFSRPDGNHFSLMHNGVR